MYHLQDFFLIKWNFGFSIPLTENRQAKRTEGKFLLTALLRLQKFE